MFIIKAVVQGGVVLDYTILRGPLLHCTFHLHALEGVRTLETPLTTTQSRTTPSPMIVQC